MPDLATRSPSMQAVRFDRYGPPEGLELRDCPVPAPRPGEVRIRVRAASVNDWDWELLHGRPLVNRLAFGLFRPRIRALGGDVAGVVDALGAGVAGFVVGDAVFADITTHGFGGFAEYVCVPARALARMPAGMSFEQAAAIPQAAMLAVQALIDTGHVAAGQQVLVNGAGGGFGTFAVQLAKLHGAEVTAVDRAEKLPALRELGADRVFDFRQYDFTRAGERYHLIVDPRTDRSPVAYARALLPGGCYATVGGSVPRLLQNWLGGYLVGRRDGKRTRVVALEPNKDLDYLIELFAAGRVVPVIDRVYALHEVPAALGRFGSGLHIGKVIVRVGAD